MSSYDLSAWPLFRSVIGDKTDAAKPRNCFFIAPMTDTNPDVRRHAETLWKYVVRPALLDTPYAGRHVQPDSDARPSQAAIDCILDDDLVIAVLSFRNPDVFYQVAIAQAAARPLVLMIEEGQELPFDPRGAKVVTYSLDTDSVFSAINVKKLHAALREIEQAEAPVRQTFRIGAGALNGGGSGGAMVYERSRQFTYDQRLTMMREARTRIDVMGLANLALAMHPDAAEVVRSRAGQGVEFRILQCAPINQGLVALLGGRNHQLMQNVCAEIEAAAEAWRRICDAPDLDITLTIRRTQAVLPLASAVITDKCVVATPYLHSLVTADSPTMFAIAGSPYHRVMQQEFDAAWSEAVTFFRAEPRLRHGAPANANSAHPGDLPRSHSTHGTPDYAAPAVQPVGGMRSFAAFRGVGPGG